MARIDSIQPPAFVRVLGTIAGVLLFGTGLTGCTCDENGVCVDDPDTTPGDPVQPPPPPLYATIRITDSLIQPWGADGKSWDGDNSVSQADFNELAGELASVNPYAGVAAFIAGLGNSAYAPPDPYGWVEIWNNGAWDPNLLQPLATIDTNAEDTFHPLWAAPGWRHVLVEPNMRFRVTIFDEDLVNDDPIGIAELNYDDVKAALEAKQQVPVRVDDQGQRQILFIGLSAIAE